MKSWKSEWVCIAIAMVIGCGSDEPNVPQFATSAATVPSVPGMESPPAASDAGETPGEGPGEAPEPTPAAPQPMAPLDDADAGSEEEVAAADPGEPCAADSDCDSNYCNNGFCCSGGECCRVDTDCSRDGEGASTQCMQPSKCQGLAGEPSCVDFRCVVDMGRNDDSACGAETTAKDCGLYADATCTGDIQQSEPDCLTACTSDAECDDTAYCEDDACKERMALDASCDRDEQCASGSCSGGKCCAGDDCCDVAEDCPDSYTYGLRCDDREQCQGSFGIAVCIDGVCGTERTDDDRRCTALTPSLLCGQLTRRFCNGESEQEAPTCGDGTGLCTRENDCPNSEHCADGMCKADLPNGSECSRDAVCASNYCNNGFCCDGGRCCTMTDQCPQTVDCLDRATCQGERYTNACSDSFQCERVASEDYDTACVGALVDSCGSFADLRCTTATEQDVSTRACATECITPLGCDLGLNCVEGQCQSPE